MDNQTLLPCPFCNDNHLYKTTDEYGDECVKCDMCSAVVYAYDKYFATAAWNTRPANSLPQ